MKQPAVSRFFDPICGMWLEAAEVTITYTYIGWTYAFCSEECRDLFARKPDVHVLRLAHDTEAHTAHCCPRQRDAAIVQVAYETTVTEHPYRECRLDD